MNAFPFLKSPSVFLEIGETSLKMLDGEDGLELSLERSENGRLTPACGERLVEALKVFLKKHRWRPLLRAYCAIGARGVSLRRLSMPASSKEELQRLLLLQIEREFPLGPDELAWGYCPLNPNALPRTGIPGAQELLVVAVKRDVLQEYADVLSQGGLSPLFTLGALARSALAPRSLMSQAVLDVGRSHSELVSYENGVPESIHVLRWGGDDVTRAIEQRLGVTRPEAEKLKVHGHPEAASNGALAQQVLAAIEAELSTLAAAVQPHWIGHPLYLTGGGARLSGLAPRLAQILGNGAVCEPLAVEPGEGRSAAILGLKKYCEQEAKSPLPLLDLRTARLAEGRARSIPWKWAALAGILGLGLLSLRYTEALLLKPRLAQKLSAAKAYRDRLPKVDRELNFLQFLKTNQPAYLDALFVMANAAPAGARIETVSMTRRGDLSLRTTLKDAPQVAEFRSRLIGSSLFASVAVEEQTPTPDRQKVVVRMVGQWKATGERKPLAASTGTALPGRAAESPPAQGGPNPNEARPGDKLFPASTKDAARVESPAPFPALPVQPDAGEAGKPLSPPPVNESTNAGDIGGAKR